MIMINTISKDIIGMLNLFMHIYDMEDKSIYRYFND